jgi:hypothetical protein
MNDHVGGIRSGRGRMRRGDGGRRRRQFRPRRAGGVAIALVAVGVLAAACGGPASSRGSAKPSGTALLLEFSACIRAHGLPDFPDPQSEAAGGGYPSGSLNPYIDPSSTGPDDFTPQLQAAEKHCRSIGLASGFIVTQAQIAQIVKRELAAVACMRKHGVPGMPDPTAQGAMLITPGDNIDVNSSQYKAAAKLCRGPQPGG